MSWCGMSAEQLQMGLSKTDVGFQKQRGQRNHRLRLLGFVRASSGRWNLALGSIQGRTHLMH